MTALFIEDPIDRMHQALWQQHRRSRYTLEDPRRRLAKRAEDAVAHRLLDLGYDVSRTGHNERFDLLVNGLRVEVKASNWLKGSSAYVAQMRGNRADVLVFGCLNRRWHWFVIPFEHIGSRTQVRIQAHDPNNHTGQWRDYLEAWEVLDRLIAAGVNHWQPGLPGVRDGR